MKNVPGSPFDKRGMHGYFTMFTSPSFPFEQREMKGICPFFNHYVKSFREI